MENYEDIDIKRILEIIFSKKIFIILILLLSITLGYVYSYYYKQPEYKSSVTILLVADENKENKELTQTDLNINTSLISTYSSIAKSTNVMQKTIDNLGLNMSTSKLQKSVETAQVDKTQFLKITVKNSNPETAKNIANELAKVFTEQIKEIYNLENISIVDEAEIENQPFNVNHAKDMIIFAFAGIFASAILVMIIYIFDDTVKDEKQIERNVKLQNLGRLPVDKERNELIIENNPKSHIVESIKTIRTNILYANNKKTILITSSKPKEGKSWIINNLAVAFAQTGKKVILVDTDLRKENNTTQIFNVEKSEGLSDFIKEISFDKLENLSKSKKYIKETKIPNLHILQNGTIPPNPSELITSENMKRLLDLLKSMYDMVLLDGTPCMVVSDSIALSSMVDSTILVAESKKTKINDLKNTKRLIEDVNGKILGVITNKADVQSGKYYGKKYGYYYGSEVKDLGKLEEKQKPISLDEVIKIAKINIEEENLNKEEIVEEIEDIQEEKQDVNHEIRSIKSEILNEIKKLKNVFAKLKTDNENSYNQLRDNIKNINYDDKFDYINSEIKNNKEEYAKAIEEVNNNISSNKEEYAKAIEEVNNNISSNKEEYAKAIEEVNNNISSNKEEYAKAIEEVNNNISSNKKEYTKAIEEVNNSISNNKEEYTKAIEEMNNKLVNNVIQQFISEINCLKDEIKELKENQTTNNTEILEKIEKVNFEEKLAEINEKIEKINYDEKLTEINNKIQDNVVKNTNNIISFESLKEKRKANKKVFKTEESINYEDLERLSTCIIDLNDELNSSKAMSN